ncbi:MAG TPA: putative sulfate exporter family transporter [Acidimicrobiales bacterium]|nr:putative sulfate exporter family transporter [Acidimicrobiales bacterium]
MSIDTAVPHTARPLEVSARRSLPHAVAALVPGAALAAAIAVAASLLGTLAPVIGAPVMAIVIGIVVATLRPPARRARPGLTFVAKRVLQASIVVLGLGLSLGQVLVAGAASLPVLLGTLLAALAAAWAVGRLLGLPRDLTTLIGVGTAICGASAIAATDAVIGAEEADVSYAVATIFTFNVVAVLAYPTLGHLLGLSQHAFGLWSGTAINDLSSVVAASTIYGHAAAGYGVVVKLTRTLAIIPIALGLAALRRRRGPAVPPGAAPASSRFSLARVLPLFILGFLAAVVANTLGLVPSGFHHGLSDSATWMITAALAAIGLSTRPGEIRRAGLRPLALGAVLWATVGSVSLALQFATGTLR